MSKTEKREVVTVKIDELRPAKYNPRKILDHDYGRLKESMKRDGLLQTILINSDNTVIAGHQRLKAAQELGWSEIMAIKVDVDKAREKEMNIHMNRNQGTFVDEELQTLVVDIADDPQGDLSRTGLTDSEITAFLDANKSELGDDVDDTEEAERTAKNATDIEKGEIITLGRHRLMCGDSTSPDDVAKLMNGKKAHLLFTDPPYNVDYHSAAGNSYTKGKYEHDGGIINDKLTDDDYRQFVTAYIKNAHDHTVPNAVFYNWLADKYLEMFKAIQLELGMTWRQNIIWLKESPTFGLGRMYMRCFETAMLCTKPKEPYFNGYTAGFKDAFARMNKTDFAELLDVWYSKRDKQKDYVHPTQKPTYLAQRAMQKNTKPGDNVLDLFGGSGSTLIAAEYMGRTAYIMEFDPFYAQVIKTRYEQFVERRRQEEDDRSDAEINRDEA